MGFGLSPASPEARDIAQLFGGVLVLSAVIFTLVTGLVLAILLRFRARGDGTEPRQTSGHTALEIAWTLGPLVIIGALYAGTVRTMHRVDPSPGDRLPDVIVTGHQWWWEMRYPRSGVVTANELHIPAGERWLVAVGSADVIHDFWVPALGRKLDAIPGHPSTMWLSSDAAGIYLGTCAEFCGAGHAWMRIRVVAQAPEEFAAWERAQSAAPAVTVGEAALGRELFDRKTCASCHAMGGTAAGANVGPDLTHFASRATLAAGAAENNRSNLERWLADPETIKPQSLMPNLRLSASEVRALATYLEVLR